MGNIGAPKMRFHRSICTQARSLPRRAVGSAGLAAITFFGSASGGTFADTLATCMIHHMTQQENSLFIQWVFGALAAHPEVSALASMSDSQYESIAHGFASTTERMLTTQCRSEAIAAIRHEGNVSIQLAFQRVGQDSARQLMSNPQVNARMATYGKYLDTEKLNALGAEAAKK